MMIPFTPREANNMSSSEKISVFKSNLVIRYVPSLTLYKRKRRVFVSLAFLSENIEDISVAAYVFSITVLFIYGLRFCRYFPA